MHRSVSIVILILVAIFGPTAALAPRDAGAESAVTARSAQADVDAQEIEHAAVTLDGRLLFKVRGIPAFPADERAAAIGERIRAIAADESVAIDSLRILEMEDRTRINAGDRLVVSFTDADTAAEGVSRQLIAERALIKIRTAIAAYRYDRSPRVLLINTLYLLCATLLLLVLLFSIRVAFRRLDGLIQLRLKARLEALEAKSQHMVQAQLLWKALQGLFKGLKVAAVLVLVYIYLHSVLGLYPWTRPFAARLLTLLMDPLRAMGLGLLKSLPGLAFVAVMVIVTRYVLKVTRLFFDSIESGTVTLARFDREWAMPSYRIARLLIIAFAMVVAYPYIPGSSSDAFKGISIFLGVVFSLGSTSVIANMMAGYTMIYRRAFRVGDRISIDNVTGDVTERRLMVTHLRTIKNEEIVVPNSTIINSNIVNYSTLAASRGLILHTTVGIGYETPWRQVEAMLLLAAERTPGLLGEPPPFVLQKSLGDFAVTYELNAYCDDPHAMSRLYTAMHRNILDLFNEHGVQIMTPAYEGDPEMPKVVPREQWYLAPATPPQGQDDDGSGP